NSCNSTEDEAQREGNSNPYPEAHAGVANCDHAAHSSRGEIPLQYKVIADRAFAVQFVSSHAIRCSVADCDTRRTSRIRIAFDPTAQQVSPLTGQEIQRAPATREGR